jgi:hypothetical protein
VVRDLGMSIGNGEGDDPSARACTTASLPAARTPAQVGLRVRGDARALRAAPPRAGTPWTPLRLYDVRPLSDVNDAELQFLRSGSGCCSS